MELMKYGNVAIQVTPSQPHRDPSPLRPLFAAPHRTMFLIGATQAMIIMAWWLVDLLGRYAGLYPPLAWSIPAPIAHGFLMIYGFFPFFIFGFLMTTYPNWLNASRVPPARYLPTAILMALAAVFFDAGLLLGKPLLQLAVVCLLGGWGIGLQALLQIQRSSAHEDKRHPRITSIALTLGWLGAATFGLWLFNGESVFLHAAMTGGIWFFLLPVFFTVSHRMLPFFSSRVLTPYTLVRPGWTLPAMLACSLGHGLLALGGRLPWLWLADLPLAILAFYLSYRWGLRRSLGVRLLAVLHLAFFWLGMALLLYAFQSAAALSGHYLLGLAPLHALAIGFFASMVLAMASRVTLGHAGRALVADRTTWLLFLGLQGAALIRILPDIVSALPSRVLYPAAAIVWLLSITPWAIKYAPLYWRPRADDKPG